MIDDIVFDLTTVIFEVSLGVAGGDIVSYSMDGESYDFTGTSGGGETSSIFIN